MARIPESELEQLKLQVSMVRLVEAAGIALKPHGKDLVGRCPFHDDKTPSLVISPKSNLWHCLGACQAGGSVVDWVMRFEHVSFRRAVELLRREIGVAPSLDANTSAPASMLEAIEQPDAPVQRTRFSRLLKQESSVIASADDQAQLNRVIEYYHATLKQSPEALAYLAQRGLASMELADAFKLGFANRTLGYRLPAMQVKSGAAVRGALQRIGILRGTGHEHFNGSLVVPVIDADGNVTEVYGRKITPRLREGTPLHLYLPGPHRGVFNEAGLDGQAEVILCEALLDALTFWAAGYRNVTASYGVEGFTADHLAAFRRHGVQRVLIAYDRDVAGDAAAAKLADQLMAEGFECYRVLFPQGMDANSYALSVDAPSAALGQCIRQAEWIGKGAAPSRELPLIVEAPAATPLPTPEPAATPTPKAATVESVVKAVAPIEAASTAPTAAPIPSLAAAVALPDVAAESTPADVVPAFAVPPLPSPPTPEVTERDVVLVLGDRRYRVRGLDKNLAYDVLKVNLMVSRGAGLHVDTLDLYHAKARALFVRLASTEIGVEEAVLQRDLGQLLLALEQQQDALIQQQLRAVEGTASAAAPAPLSADDEAAALAFLRAPDLIERIVADFEQTGLVGEPSNALVGYLAAVSRKLAAPLAILVQSTSAAGKSALMDAVLRFVPEAERIHYSAMTGQSLFYLGEKDLKHKILAIAEEEGVRQASYALKLLQSQGELTIASTGKDPTTGKLVTEEYRVEGPVMLFLTTTAIDVDEELLNRCLVLSINESREQTRAIQQRQRAQRTLAGLLADSEAEAILRVHRHAQQLLRPLAVVNPYADRLGFLDDRTRTRRDHQKYLTLIEAIAYLHQHQRDVRAVEYRGRRIEYIEVAPSDIALANRLAHEVLGRSLDELPPQTRRLLGTIRAHVAERADALAMRPGDVRFTRRELRERAALSEVQLRVHVERLVELEYLLPHRGQRGQSYVYELLFDGEVGESAPRLPGLIDIEALESEVMTPSSRGSKGEFAGSSRPHRGGFAAGSRDAETAPQASTDAACSDAAAIEAPNARRGKANGAAHRSASSAVSV